MRLRLVLSLLFVASTAALAQSAPTPLVQEPPPLEGRRNQKVEILHAEDNSVVIDEVRFGGQTQSIRVKPKSNMPAYEMQPTDLARSHPDPRESGTPASRRVWNVLGF